MGERQTAICYSFAKAEEFASAFFIPFLRRKFSAKSLSVGIDYPKRKRLLSLWQVLASGAHPTKNFSAKCGSACNYYSRRNSMLFLY
jgi:hypothetical protein